MVIFKHSTRCSISAMALNRLERDFDQEQLEGVPVYFLDLISFRELSNRVAEEFSVMHQSPQVLLIKNGQCVYDDSHMGISFNDLVRAVGKS
ncbi:MAG: bacillithiol system redox-active protein YtxJ [Bacteroidota bacterium]